MIIKKEAIKKESLVLDLDRNSEIDHSSIMYRWYRRAMDDLMSIYSNHPSKLEARRLINIAFYLLKLSFDLVNVPEEEVRHLRSSIVEIIPRLTNQVGSLKGVLDLYLKNPSVEDGVEESDAIEPRL